MANVDDRGQLILITGLVLAIGFVALVLLLNTAIYTENLASRGSDVGTRDAIEFRHTTIESIGTVLEEENELEYDSRSAVKDSVDGDIEELDNVSAANSAQFGVVADLSDRQLHEGTWLRQTDSSRNMSDHSGTLNWTLTEDANGIRDFSVNVAGGLESTSTPEADAYNISVIGSGGDRWSLYVYDDSAPKLAVQNGSETSPNAVCSSQLPSSPPFTVNLTAGSVDGADCAAIDFAKGTTPPYDVTYTWGNRSEGTYNLTVNSTTTHGFDDFGDPGQPEKIPIVYSVSLELTYENGELAYRERVRIVPEADP